MTWWSRNTSSQSRRDLVLGLISRTSSVLSATVILLIFLFLLHEASPALAKVGISRFFTDTGWHPLSAQFNIVPMLMGTILTTLGAVVIATPLGLAAAIYGLYFAPQGLAIWYRRLIELMAGIPSVVFGLWGLVKLAPWIGQFGGSGQNLLTATIVLALMILPTVMLTAWSSMASVPPELLRGGAALGLRNWSIVRTIVLPAAWGGIGVGILLATARALGETMAVLMVAGNVVEVPTSLLDPVRTLTANIALEMGYATSAHRSILFASGLILMGLVASVAVVAELRKRSPHEL
ncbi:phosphate ABC transporter permease subunit PstC [Rubinisphaera margarita]|uniref:phosphate ABC transporter permease subunit PstC n=1 Tax=Rubinisphaera margarita TaxID=2909586 RepID=UPI001EE8E83C|nr:phosphate ABC transporter permease subunit PstC [Rubinisphaera margarita]MCG6158121.1 phosphate ABC transporter permease subunit PstC [Rubinisphaera margarita]